MEVVTRAPSPYQLFMLALCVYALVALGVYTLVPLRPQAHQILAYSDTGICILFLVDFCISLLRAKRRWRYLYTWGWIDLASSIPAVHALRWGRIARMARIFRVLRGVRATKVIGGFVLERRAEGGFLAAAFITLLLLVFSSIAILQLESGPDSNIKTAQDALWWAFTTITTIGYGDVYPVTAEGRLVAVVLMGAGVGLFGAFAGFVAAWFLKPCKPDAKADLDQLHKELREIRESIRRLEENRRS